MSVEIMNKSDLARMTRWLDKHRDVKYSVKGGQGGTMVFVLDQQYV
jgi:hypothetical protein